MRQLHQAKRVEGKMSNIAYSAVVLDEKSHNLLRSLIPTIVPKSVAHEWNPYCHHMTINMGELPAEKKGYLGKEIRLYVTHIDWDTKVMAVKVKDNENLSVNKTPHVTLAVNKNAGGKPVMSNDLSQWKPLKRKFYIFGKVEEVKR